MQAVRGWECLSSPWGKDVQGTLSEPACPRVVPSSTPWQAPQGARLLFVQNSPRHACSDHTWHWPRLGTAGRDPSCQPAWVALLLITMPHLGSAVSLVCPAPGQMPRPDRKGDGRSSLQLYCCTQHAAA